MTHISEAGIAREAADCLEAIRRLEAALKLAQTQLRSLDEYAVARRILRTRRLRDQLFPENLFADPAWDLLLDLFVSSRDGKRVSVSSACVAAAVPPTTALRWIAQLETKGMVERRADPHDKRRIFVDITSTAVELLKASLRSMIG